MLSLVCMITVANEPAAVKSLTLDGEYLAERNIKCEVFLLYSDSTLELTETVKSHRYFNVKLEASLSYVLKFTSKDGKVKYLYVPEAIPGEFMFDVDFASNSSATLKYDQKASKLKLERTDTRKIPIREQ